MKLLITKINNNASKVNELAKQFYCKTEEQKDEITITKNPQLTDDEFGVLAGKLVITGFNVELLKPLTDDQLAATIQPEATKQAVAASTLTKAEQDRLAKFDEFIQQTEQEYEQDREEEYNEYGQYKEAIRAELEAESKAERALKSHRY